MTTEAVYDEKTRKNAKFCGMTLSVVVRGLQQDYDGEEIILGLAWVLRDLIDSCENDPMTDVRESIASYLLDDGESSNETSLSVLN